MLQAIIKVAKYTLCITKKSAIHTRVINPQLGLCKDSKCLFV